MTPTLPLEVGSARKWFDRGFGVAHELLVGDAAGLAGGGRRVVGIDVEALAGVEVGAQGVVARGGEAPGDLLGPRVPTRQVVDDEHARERAVAGGEGLVGVDLGALGTRRRSRSWRRGLLLVRPRVVLSLLACSSRCRSLRCAHYGAANRPPAHSEDREPGALARIRGRARASASRKAPGGSRTGMMSRCRRTARSSSSRRWPAWRLVSPCSVRPRRPVRGRGAAVPPVHTVLGAGTLDAPGAIALDAAGDLFVADTGHCRVLVVAGPHRDLRRSPPAGGATRHPDRRVLRRAWLHRAPDRGGGGHGGRRLHRRGDGGSASRRCAAGERAEGGHRGGYRPGRFQR